MQNVLVKTGGTAREGTGKEGAEDGDRSLRAHGERA